MEDVPVPQEIKPEEQPPLTRTVQIVPIPTGIVEPCECGTVIAINDPHAIQALTQGKTGSTACPNCGRKMELTVSKILVAPNRAMRRAQEAQGESIKLVRVK